ncbi:MAG: hypothetical protein KGO50_02800, partial [Myxococcales bacterium]|nr:hypothetical protein [Myxococcales bacterium]
NTRPRLTLDAHARRTTALQRCGGAGVALVVICCTLRYSVVNSGWVAASMPRWSLGSVPKGCVCGVRGLL